MILLPDTAVVGKLQAGKKNIHRKLVRPIKCISSSDLSNKLIDQFNLNSWNRDINLSNEINKYIEMSFLPR